jgi:hypothetical protein
MSNAFYLLDHGFVVHNINSVFYLNLHQVPWVSYWKIS